MTPMRLMSTAPTNRVGNGAAPVVFHPFHRSRCFSSSRPRWRMPVSSSQLPSTFTPLTLTEATMKP